MRERAHARVESLHIRLHDQVPAEFLRIRITELYHLLKLPFRIDVHQRERDLARSESLLGQTDHHGRILPDGIKHNRILKLGGYLTDDVDRLGLQLL